MGQGSGDTAPRARGGGTFAAEAALLGVAVAWGASYPVAKGALVVASVLALVVLRFAISAAVTGALSRRALLAARASDLAGGVALGCILFAIFMAETAGVALTSATDAAFLISLASVFTPMLDHALSGRLPPGGVLAGAALCCLGAAVLGGGLSGLTGGDALMLCAAALRAVLVVATQRLATGRALPPAALTAVQSATVASLAGLTLLAVPGAAAPRAAAGPEFWGAVLFLSLVCTVGALLVQNAALRRTSPTRVAFLFGTEPVFGFVFAHLLLGEPLSARALAGGGLILAGTALGLAASRTAPRDPDAPSRSACDPRTGAGVVERAGVNAELTLEKG